MTQKKYLHFEDEVEIKSHKKVKHARNPKGKGMRILNSNAEDYYDEDDLDYEFEAYEASNTHTNTN